MAYREPQVDRGVTCTRCANQCLSCIHISCSMWGLHITAEHMSHSHSHSHTHTQEPPQYAQSKRNMDCQLWVCGLLSFAPSSSPPLHNARTSNWLLLCGWLCASACQPKIRTMSTFSHDVRVTVVLRPPMHTAAGTSEYSGWCTSSSCRSQSSPRHGRGQPPTSCIHWCVETTCLLPLYTWPRHCCYHDRHGHHCITWPHT